MSRGNWWSAEESARLRRLVKTGAVDAEIAGLLGRSRETVTRKRKLLGLAPGSSPAYRAALARQAERKARKQMTQEANTSTRPTIFTQELADELCRRLADGTPLRRILRDPAMPSRDTIQRWRREQPDFADSYGAARQDLLEALAEDALDRASDATSALDATTTRAFMTAVRLCAGVLESRRPRATSPKPPAPGVHRSPFGETLEEAFARAQADA